MRNSPAIAFASLTVIAVCSSSAVAQKPPASSTRFYSTQCYEAESGDAAGTYFKFVRTAAGETLELGWPGEGPMEGLPAANLQISPPAKNGSAKFSYDFTLPGETQIRHGAGTMSAREVRIKGVDDRVTVIPRRPLAYRPSVCK